MDYFAYGSNLLTRFMQAYCPGAAFRMKADLPNFRVDFPHYSEERQGGTSSIVEAPGSLVRGVIYTVPDAEIEAMDILEGLPEGLYKRETFLVLGEDGAWYPADLYRLVEPKGPFPPSVGYLSDMIEGAREHGLDPEYVAKLESIAETRE